MDLEELKKLNKQAASETEEFFNEFHKVYKKMFAKLNKRMAIINFIHLPLNGLMNMIEQDKDNVMCEVFPELPDMFARFMMPFIMLRHRWGKIPNEKFVEEYGKLHSSQFNSWFGNKESMEQFKKWFDAENGKEGEG